MRPSHRDAERTVMKAWKLLYLLVGLALLAFVLANTDLAAVWTHVRACGWSVLWVPAVFGLGFALETLAWQQTLAGGRPTPRWLYELFKIRMVGAAFAKVMPFSAWGGAPIKAYLLKRHHGVPYRESTASMIVVETSHLIAMVVLMALGVVLAIVATDLDAQYRRAAVVGLGALVAGIGGFFVVQRFKLTSTAGRWLSRRGVGRVIERALHVVQDLDDRIAGFYTRDRSRFVRVLLLELTSWFLGALEVFVILAALGHAVTFTEAVVIEALVELVRAGTFFIPATLGSQDGAFLVVVGAITGHPTLGLATGLVRRGRELLWLAAGIAIGLGYPEKPAHMLEGARSAAETESMGGSAS